MARPAAHVARIIPAYAGNTCTGEAQEPLVPGSSPHTRGTPALIGHNAPSYGDHPRIRGEHLRVVHGLVGVLRIIPAYAGNTVKSVTPSAAARGSSPHTRGTRLWSWPIREGRRDHPRIRGEHPLTTSADSPKRGIIPAYAGNTVTYSSSKVDTAGSSPHTRGTPPVPR